MDNTQATTLSDIVEAHDFFENLLDVYESYTYNIEWFVVDIDADRKFQQFGETLNVATVVNDGWPGVGDTKITIAKTGVTTEINITDLTVEGSGVGIASTSKIAGTAIALDFTVTEVGETSLVDNLQNAIALTGWKSIDQTHFYIKINFVGVDTNGVKVKIPQTKVLTFTLQRLTKLQSQTDARGTSTLLRGTILQDSVIGDKLSLSSTEHQFSYIVGETLEDTLGIVSKDVKEPKEGSFIDKLNKSVKVTHPTLLPNLQNTYKITMSDRFKTMIKGTSMRGVTSSTIKNMRPPIASQEGSVPPLMNIYSAINDICLNAIKIKEELLKDTPTLSKVYKIIPWCVPKEGGWNPVSGTMAYNVEFFIDYDEKRVDQHILDQANKAANINKTIEKLFNKRHINKIYHYLFTGKNDQIIDFDISLDSYLAKVYSAPTDWYAYENILKAGTIEGNKLLEGYSNKVENAQEVQKDLLRFQKEHQKMVDLAKANLKNEDDSLRNDLLNAYMSTLAPGDFHGRGNTAKKEAEKFLNSHSFEEVLSATSKNVDNQFMVTGFLQRFNNREKLKEQVEKAVAKSNQFNVSRTEWSKHTNTLYGDSIASHASVSGEHNWNNGVKQNAQNILSGVKNKNPKNMILVEELDNDIISKMSNDDFENILKAQANNPVVYKTLISTLSKNKSAVTMKTTDVEGIEMARAKYYESKTNDVSMINARMTIKGDPHWIDGYMPPSVAEKEFGDVGAVSEKGYSMLKPNEMAVQYVILKSGVAHGTDLHDNVLKRNLITSMYSVNNIVSNFTGGLFTQTLTMTKMTDADDMSSVVPTVGPEPEELGDTDDNGPSTRGGRAKFESWTGPVATEAKTNLEMGFNADGTNPNYHGSLAEQHGTGLIYKGRVLTPEEVMMMEAMKPYENRTGPGQKVISTIVDNHLTKNTAQYVEAQTVTTEQTITAQNDMVITPMPDGNAAIRNVLANQTLKQLEDLRNICKVEQKRGQIPFVACDTINNINGEMLETFGLTEEDKGKASTITAMNTQINSWITNDGITFNDEEIAVYQIAAGGQLDIIGHDKDVVEKLVRKATLERTPVIILEEQAVGKATEVVSGSHQNHAIANNKILDGSKPLVDEQVDKSLVNVDLEETYEEIVASGEDVTKKLMLLSADLNEQAKQQYFEDKKNEKILKESEPKKFFNPETRRLEIKGVNNSTLTDSELFDVSVLSDGINNIVEKTVLTSDDIHREITWKENAVEIIEKEIIDEELVVSDEEKTAMKFSAATSINKSVALDALSNDDYATVSSYATAINKITGDSQSGHRGDLTKAVNIGKIQGELVTSGLKQDAILNKTYYFDPSHRVVDAISLEELELEAAVLELGLPAEKITAVATKVTGNDTTYVPIQNPVAQIEVDKAPILVKTALNTMDIILPGSLKSRYSKNFAGEGIGWEYAMANPNKVTQYNEAKKIYKLITSYDIGDMTTVTDDMGNDIEVKDFSNIAPIIYTDANGVSTTISNPSTFFGIYTTTYNDMNPAYSRDYDALKEKIADLFPDIKSGQESQLINGKLPTKKDGRLEITITGDKFYIDPTP